ncbi:uncharacterized protein PSFLO_05596 [Pseudozyma flocculosa]|nr:uncharacterized protein PSFLO_05596 [Pseudozyma flocculosa]
MNAIATSGRLSPTSERRATDLDKWLCCPDDSLLAGDLRQGLLRLERWLAGDDHSFPQRKFESLISDCHAVLATKITKPGVPDWILDLFERDLEPHKPRRTQSPEKLFHLAEAFKATHPGSRSHECIQYILVKGKLRSESYSLDFVRSADRGVADDFVSRPYLGLGPQHLEHHLATWERDFRPKLHYAKVTAVLQSSGFGKTRLVYETAKTTLGLLLCVRNQDTGAPSGVSAPPADQEVRTFLTAGEDPGKTQKIKNEVEPFEATRNIACFLAAVAFEVSRVVRSKTSAAFPPSDGMAKEEWQSRFVAPAFREMHDGIEKARYDAEYSGSARHTFISRLVRQAKAMVKYGSFLSDVELEDPALREDLDDGDAWKKGDYWDKERQKSTLKSNAEFFASSLARYFKKRADPTGSLEAALPTLKEAQLAQPLFFLAIDECQALGVVRLAIVRRFWSHLDPKRQWILLIDTHSTVANIAGRDATDASERFLTQNVRLVSPFVNTPIDSKWTSSGPDARGTISRLRGASRFELERLALLYGRPLWEDQVLAQAQGPKFGGASLWAVACKILCSGVEWPLLPEDEQQAAQQVIAVLSQRLPLTIIGIQGNTDPRTLSDDMVARHLRMVARVGVNGDMAITFTPSEPVCSAAAALLMRMNPAPRWADCISELQRRLSSRHVHFGEDGEEVARMLLSIAADLTASFEICPRLKATHKHKGQVQGTIDRERLAASQELFALENSTDRGAILDPMPVHSWLNTLCGPLSQSDRSTPSPREEGQSRQPNATSSAWMKSAYINFTHYARLGKQTARGSPIPQELLVDGWLRQCAWLGVSNQSDWDILIPVYTPPGADTAAAQSDGVAAAQSDGVAHDWSKDLFEPSAMTYIFVQIKNRASFSMASMAPEPGTAAFDNDLALEPADDASAGRQQLREAGPTQSKPPASQAASGKPRGWHSYQAPGILTQEGDVEHKEHLWIFFNFRGIKRHEPVLWDSQAGGRHACLLTGLTHDTFRLLGYFEDPVAARLERLLGIVAAEDGTERRLRRVDPATYAATQCCVQPAIVRSSVEEALVGISSLALESDPLADHA